jgi:hypothetical protein
LRAASANFDLKFIFGGESNADTQRTL